MTSDESAMLRAPRDLGAVNWVGLRAMIGKEVGRFIKVYAQTISAPIMTTLLFYAVFAIALGGNGRMVNGLPYVTFLVPGLIMMSMAQNAFANSSSSLVISKVQGNIVDVLMPPLSALELAIGYMTGGIIRGLVVGLGSVAVVALVTPLTISHFGFVLFHGVMGSMMLSLMGLIGGIWSDKFDHIAAVQNFIVMPATFLSGTFFEAARLPGNWSLLCHLNPFFYMIDGFRYGFTGFSDGTLGVGIVVLIGTNALLFALSYAMLASGYKLKS